MLSAALRRGGVRPRWQGTVGGRKAGVSQEQLCHHRTVFLPKGVSAMADGTPLNLSDKDQKWLGLQDTFRF